MLTPRPFNKPALGFQGGCAPRQPVRPAFSGRSAEREALRDTHKFSSGAWCLVYNDRPAHKAPQDEEKAARLHLHLCQGRSLIKAQCQPGKKGAVALLTSKKQPNTPFHRLMFKGGRREGCGVRSFLRGHRRANGNCHQRSPCTAGSQPTFPSSPPVQ